ncbi:transposable element Tcb2 transposase [Trichonephila clavipes]|nr:transposable element Tcb2 transposase [Trichonephila clavipes]
MVDYPFRDPLLTTPSNYRITPSERVADTGGLFDQLSSLKPTICPLAKTEPNVQSVTMTGHIYQDVILEQHVCLFRDTMGAEFLFMDDDKARPHRANIVDECL